MAYQWGEERLVCLQSEELTFRSKRTTCGQRKGGEITSNSCITTYCQGGYYRKISTSFDRTIDVCASQGSKKRNIHITTNDCFAKGDASQCGQITIDAHIVRCRNVYIHRGIIGFSSYICLASFCFCPWKRGTIQILIVSILHLFFGLSLHVALRSCIKLLPRVISNPFFPLITPFAIGTHKGSWWSWWWW